MDYWKDRMAASQANRTNKTIRDIEKQLTKHYQKAMLRTIEDFEDTYYRVLKAKAEDREPTPADLYKLDKYWQSQANLKKELEKLGEKEVSILSRYFEMNYKHVYDAVAIPGSNVFSSIDSSTVKQLINQIWCADGKSWSQRIWGDTERLAATLNEELIHCVATGKKPSELKKRLMNEFEVSFNRADSVVRTELAHIQTQAAKQRYQDAGVQEVEIWADKDERRCKVCGELHKTRYPVGAAVPIPAHPRCRCCIVPVI